MEATLSAAPASRARVWTGRVVSGLATAFLLLDAVSHLLAPAPVVDAFHRLGLAVDLAAPLGILELLCLAAYAWPRSAVLGAVLLTGYLGGAISINLRAGSPAFETVFPAILGALVWAGLYLRDGRLRELVPLRGER